MVWQHHQTPINPLDQPTNPTNQRRRSENFEEKLRLFQRQEDSKNVNEKNQHPNSTPSTSPNKSTTSTYLENEAKNNKPETKSQHPHANQLKSLI